MDILKSNSEEIVEHYFQKIQEKVKSVSLSLYWAGDFDFSYDLIVHLGQIDVCEHENRLSIL